VLKLLKQLSVQLWSVHEDVEKDFFGILEKLAQIGYTGVEFAGYGNISSKDMKNKLNELNLNAVSSHVGLDNLQRNLDKEIEYVLDIGAKYIVCPWAEIDSVESALVHADIFNKIGERCKAAGLVFAYHNHAHEFKMDRGQYPLEVLFDNTDQEYVKQQPDVYWIAYAGIDVNEYMRKNISRCPTIHLKQIENHETKTNVDAGDGIIDFKYLIDLAPDADFIYEQEEFVGARFDSLEKSFNFIMNK